MRKQINPIYFLIYTCPVLDHNAVSLEPVMKYTYLQVVLYLGCLYLWRITEFVYFHMRSVCQKECL